MAETSEYEQLRLKRIEENRHMLFQLGLLPEDWKPPVFKPQNPFIRKPVAVKKKKRVESTDDLPSRRSLRSVNSNEFDDGELTDSVNGDYAESDCSNSSKEKYKKNRVNSYGAIEGVAIGEIWETRMECSRAGIHRPPVSGIHPGPEGAYSIALSGGYEDNYDGGESFTYTGAGGRELRGTSDKPKNLRTGPQVKDQTLEGANASLANSVKTRQPVRVIRGYKSNSPFSPEFGYRYDGLYQVEKYWTTKGLSGHLVYKFALKRCLDQDPPPWSAGVEDSTDESTTKSPSKDGENIDSMNPFVHLGKKVDDLNDRDELETNVNNGKLHNPYKMSEKEQAINNNVDVLGVKNNLNSTFDTIKNDNTLSCTPELNGSDKRKSKKLSPEKSSASVHKNVSPKDVLKSPKKISPKNSPLKNKSEATSTTPSKSPVKMIASNQSLDELAVISADYNDVKNDSLELGKSPKVQRTLSSNSKPNLSKAPTSDSNPDSSLSNNKEVPENENIVQNNPLPVSFKDTTGYLKSRRKSQDGSSNVNNTGKKKGKKRSPSPDDFAKICDELCNELPKIEKIKRLRFSFDNFSDNDLEVNVVKARRKRASRTPRKSSLIKDMKQKSVKGFEEQSKSNEDLVFSKFIDIWLADFAFDESFNDWLGWDDYDLFEGWSDKEVTEAKKYSASFADFIFKCNENSEENSWAGWEDDVSRRSLVLNGFLLEEMSRNRRCSDSDGTEAPEEFLGFQQQNQNSC
ncbi:uncharacterized protein LOC142326996 isoform X2 [Lycorma delicatula]|uniref:uncharacterized protein LOC142326996 isoform X2 n=1 Tax=Lycorma delicatula TaxID=130591 RepID=UPI003F519638